MLKHSSSKIFHALHRVHFSLPFRVSLLSHLSVFTDRSWIQRVDLFDSTRYVCFFFSPSLKRVFVRDAAVVVSCDVTAACRRSMPPQHSAFQLCSAATCRPHLRSRLMSSGVVGGVPSRDRHLSSATASCSRVCVTVEIEEMICFTKEIRCMKRWTTLSNST